MKIEIIPAIDIIDGQCVRLTQGDYDQKTVYAASPVEVALQYEAIGLRRLHVVDLDGAKASEPKNLDALRLLASATGLEIQYGGGIKSGESLQKALNAGAHRVICGSVAITQPELFEAWLAEYGPERIVLGADVKEGYVATHGWLERSEVSAEELIERFAAKGLQQVICTDIARDGMLQGPNFDLYLRLQKSFPQIEITVSGGISTLDDLHRLDALGLRSVIVGKAIYEGRITLEELASC